VNDWIIFKYDVTNAPVALAFEWIYTKFNIQGETDNMGAELEFIRASGLEFAPK
jgi:hypothetical protein